MTVVTETAAETAAKPDPYRAPKPKTAYITATPDWNPATDGDHWHTEHRTPTEARHSMEFATFCGCDKVLLKAVTTYEVVGDNFADVKDRGDG